MLILVRQKTDSSGYAEKKAGLKASERARYACVALSPLERTDMQ